MNTTFIILTLGVLFNIICLINAEKIENDGKMP